MKDLWKAAKKGPKAFANSALDFPHRRPFLISGIAGSLAIVLLIFAPGGLQSQGDQIDVTKNEVTQIKALCGPAALRDSPRAAARCAERMRAALLNCRRTPACLRALEGRGVVTTDRPERSDEQGVVVGSGSNPSGQAGGGKPPPSDSEPGQGPSAPGDGGEDDGEPPGGGGGGGQGGGGDGGSGDGDGDQAGGGDPGTAVVEGAPGPQGPEGPPGQSAPPGPVGGAVGEVVGGVGGIAGGAVEVVCSVLEQLQGRCPR